MEILELMTNKRILELELCLQAPILFLFRKVGRILQTGLAVKKSPAT